MKRKKILLLLIVVGLLTSSLILLFLPFKQAKLDRIITIPYSETIDQIDLIADIDGASVTICYNENSTMNLFTLSYSIRGKYSLISSLPSISMRFNNFTLNSHLIVNLSLKLTSPILSEITSADIILSINPTLRSNLSLHTSSNNLKLDTTNYMKKMFTNVNLSSTSGNIEVFFSQNCNLSGNLSLSTEYGAINLFIGQNCNLGGDLSLSSISGSCNLLLENNVSATNYILLFTESGEITANTSDITLVQTENTWQFSTYTGNIHLNINQWSDPQGNLSIIVSNLYGSTNFEMHLEANNISSNISVNSSFGGTININPDHPGYYSSGTNLNSEAPHNPSNFDANIGTLSGNVDIYATRT
ncbi:MAG: hypothetical protein ACTSYB_08795 [Candidatus Helarchaeota archaeon]